jgi:hypothetical protein
MRASSLAVSVAATILTLLPASLSQAGDNNTVYIKQESPAGSLNGNSLTIDQSDATNSLLVGPSVSSLAGLLNVSLPSSLQGGQNPASQRGEGNEAKITMTGDGGALMLVQDTSPFQAMQPAGSGTGNTATAVLNGASLGAVIQLGTANTANLQLEQANGLITQLGSNLRADLAVTGPDSRGQIVQIGSRNTADVEVQGSGTNVTYTQIGNDLTSSQTMEVFSTNSGNISITQTGF